MSKNKQAVRTRNRRHYRQWQMAKTYRNKKMRVMRVISVL
nr:MAG TPA: hypothetical protein [Caudoviricetes sp.]